MRPMSLGDCVAVPARDLVAVSQPSQTKPIGTVPMHTDWDAEDARAHFRSAGEIDDGRPVSRRWRRPGR